MAFSSLFAQAPAVAPSPGTTPGQAAKDEASQSGYSENTNSSTMKMGFSSVNTTEPYVALTFDDGPQASLTPKLLDILKARHIHATFFVVGENAAEYPDILKRIIAEGHEIGNHSWSHPNFAKMPQDSVRSQIQRTQDAIAGATGVTPKILRPPYGSITEQQRHWLQETLGFKIIMWSVDPLDWKNRNSEIVARRILAEAHPGSIILAHDIHATTVEAMPNVIDTLLAKGFKFKTVSELIAMDQPRVVGAGAEPSPKQTEKKSKKTK